MSNHALSLTLANPEDTEHRAKELARRLEAGDSLLLEGPLGVGKTHFARALIQELLDEPEDVPSPSFTLVQTYHGSGHEIWHADLYRLSSSEEVDELGLIDARETAICVIEWPDRLQKAQWANALSLAFTYEDAQDVRRLSANWSAEAWHEKLAPWKA
ncbi:MAG: tRNA (adenosine(37)-N6)-threonylcarbamoyltransferase complex ATPase subunit type 1 TsaE [Pseudomonadota bacterium]